MQTHFLPPDLPSCSGNNARSAEHKGTATPAKGTAIPAEGLFHPTTCAIAGIDAACQTNVTAGRKPGSKLGRNKDCWKNQTVLVFTVDEEMNTDITMRNDNQESQDFFSSSIQPDADLVPKPIKWAKLGLKYPKSND